MERAKCPFLINSEVPECKLGLNLEQRGNKYDTPSICPILREKAVKSGCELQEGVTFNSIRYFRGEQSVIIRFSNGLSERTLELFAVPEEKWN